MTELLHACFINVYYIMMFTRLRCLFARQSRVIQYTECALSEDKKYSRMYFLGQVGVAKF